MPKETRSHRLSCRTVTKVKAFTELLKQRTPSNLYLFRSNYRSVFQIVGQAKDELVCFAFRADTEKPSFLDGGDLPVETGVTEYPDGAIAVLRFKAAELDDFSNLIDRYIGVCNKLAA